MQIYNELLVQSIIYLFFPFLTDLSASVCYSTKAVRGQPVVNGAEM